MDNRQFLINASLLVNETQRNDIFSLLNDDNASEITIIVLETLLEEILGDNQQEFSKIKALLEKQERVTIKDYHGVQGNGIVISHINQIREILSYHTHPDQFHLLVYFALAQNIPDIITDDPNLILRTKSDNFLKISLPLPGGEEKTYRLKILSLDEFKNSLNSNPCQKSMPVESSSSQTPPVTPPNVSGSIWKNWENKINILLLIMILLKIGIIVFAIIKVMNIAQAKPQFFVGDDMSRGEEFLSPPKISEEKCKFKRTFDTESELNTKTQKDQLDNLKKAEEDFGSKKYLNATQKLESVIEILRKNKKENPMDMKLKKATEEYFQKEKYADSEREFESVIMKNKENRPNLRIGNDPELQIYQENAKARRSKNFLSIAVVVPLHKKNIDGSTDYTSTYCNRGRPILFGVAMAQKKINITGILIKGQKYHLEVVIANDRNDKDYKSKEIARKIVQDKSILGVIGHNSSSATKAALDEYRGNIVVVTSTSTASDLEKEMTGMFYRTVTSNQKLSERLADYLADKNIKNVAVVYEKGDVSSEDYLKSLKDYSDKKEKGIKLIREIEFKQSKNRSPTDIIKENVNFSVGAILHFTQTEDAQKFSLKLIEENAKQAKLPMLGGDSLYECDKLSKYSSGLILSVPWFNGANEASKRFNKDVSELAGGDVNWRTATSYDATIAFNKAFSKYDTDIITSITRDSLGGKMQHVQLSEDETSGAAFKLSDKDTMPSPQLVEVVPKKIVQKNDNKICDNYEFEKFDD
jgi:branched-chain amino acid transport system substrate-binding protein